MHRLSIARSNEGGVEEKKEDDAAVLSPTASVPNGQAPFSDDAACNNINSSDGGCDNMEDGFQAHVHKFATTVLGSCGNALSFLGWPGAIPTHSPVHRGGMHNKPPLSITDELRKLAAKEGRVFGGGMRRTDIPRFLGEEGVYSFEDDNISAISQHTIEEMAKHGIKYPVRRKESSESSQTQNTPPSPMLGSAAHRRKQRGREEGT